MAIVDLGATGPQTIQTSLSFQKFRKFKLDLYIPGGILVILILGCFLGPIVFSIPGPNAGSLSDADLPLFAAGHLLGTNALGNDMLSRCLYGGRVSIVVGVGAVALGLLAGASAGMVAGYMGGTIDTVIMRILDMLLAFPSLVLALAVATYLGPSERDVIIAIAFFTAPAYGRLARAITLKTRQQEFILLSELMGAKSRYVLSRHVAPHVAPSLMTYGLLMVAVSMIIEASLSFLGLGVPPPQPSWGSMISFGLTYLSSNPSELLVPACFLFVAVLSLNSLGESLRSRWNV